MNWSQTLGFAFSAFYFSSPDLKQIRPVLDPAFHAYKNPEKQPFFSFLEFLLRHKLNPNISLMDSI